jgi:hypothetical protein
MVRWHKPHCRKRRHCIPTTRGCLTSWESFAGWRKDSAKRSRTIRSLTALDPEYPEPLYKLGQAYTRLGRPEEAKNAIARHLEVLNRAEAAVYRRAIEIQSFVLKMGTPQ